MTTQPKTEQLADELENTPFLSTRYEAAAKLRSLEAANAELVEALVDLVCLYPLDSTDAIITSARAAIKKHGGAA